MKSIALCTKIHIPVIYHKHPFSEMKITDKFYNERQTRNHAEQLAENKLLPFLQSAEMLLDQYGDRFKMALSISGISIKLLEKYAPQVLEGIKHLATKGAVEFMARPWSNSILSSFIQKELTLQTNLHRRTIKATFGQLPRVFMADLPLNTKNYSDFKPFQGCKTIFTCSNHLRKNCWEENILHEKKSQFLINYSLSQKLQHLSSYEFKNPESNTIAPFLRYLRKHVSMVRPLVLVFDPLAKNISNYSKWKKNIELLLNKTKCSFYSLSDLEEIANYFSIDNNYSEEMMEQFKAPDYWLKNNMQKEAFKQFKNIYKTINTTGSAYLPEAWDYLQDINNFLYMSDSFFLEEFSKQNFNPFRSPHEAFTSYMNAISNFWIVSHNNLKSVIRTNFIISPASN